MEIKSHIQVYSRFDLRSDDALNECSKRESRRDLTAHDACFRPISFAIPLLRRMQKSRINIIPNIV